jgi:hypothetical protein
MRDLVNFWEAITGEKANEDEVRQFRAEMQKLGMLDDADRLDLTQTTTVASGHKSCSGSRPSLVCA